MTMLANKLNYDREVIRVWFCNKRQALKNTIKKFKGPGGLDDSGTMSPSEQMSPNQSQSQLNTSSQQIQQQLQQQQVQQVQQQQVLENTNHINLNSHSQSPPLSSLVNLSSSWSLCALLFFCINFCVLLFLFNLYILKIMKWKLLFFVKMYVDFILKIKNNHVHNQQ